jgi:hypothetical protein
MSLAKKFGKSFDEVLDLAKDLAVKMDALPVDNVAGFKKLNDEYLDAMSELKKIDPDRLDNIFDQVKLGSRRASIATSTPNANIVDPIKNVDKIVDETGELVEAITEGTSSAVYKGFSDKLGRITIATSPNLFDASGNFIRKVDLPFQQQWARTFNNMTGGATGWMVRNPATAKLIVGTTLVGVTIGSIIVASQISADEINKKTYNITSIEKSEDGKTTIIVFDSQGDDIVSGDEIYIEESNSTPNIDGIQQPIKFNTSGITQIKKVIQRNGTLGTLKIKTSMKNRANDSASKLGQGVGGVVGAATGGILDELLGTLGLGSLGKIGEYISWAVLVCCLCMSTLVSVYLVYKFSD